MDTASTCSKKSSAFFMSFHGFRYQDLNQIISGLKKMKANVKNLRDIQASVFQDMTNWACNDESRLLKDLFVQMLDLTSLWYEIQSQFAEQITEFRSNFEMILEGEKNIDSARSKLADTEAAEHKAKKKLKKMQKKEAAGDISAITNKVDECKRQREMAQVEVSHKIQEHESVKLIRVKEGLAKFSEAYLELAQKCIYIFEGHRDICRAVPDVEGMEMHEITIGGRSGARDILLRTRERVSRYRNVSNTGTCQAQRNYDPPPPYTPDNYYQTPAYNPYYAPRQKSIDVPGRGTYLGATSSPEVAVNNARRSVGLAERTTSIAQGPAGIAEGAAGIAEGAAGIAEGAAGIAEGAAGIAEGAAGIAEGAAGIAEGAAGIAEGAAGIAERAASNTAGRNVNKPGNNQRNASEPNVMMEDLAGALLSSVI